MAHINFHPADLQIGKTTNVMFVFSINGLKDKRVNVNK